MAVGLKTNVPQLKGQNSATPGSCRHATTDSKNELVCRGEQVHYMLDGENDTMFNVPAAIHVLQAICCFAVRDNS